MATETEHRQQAQRNQDFLDSIDAAKFPEWAVTVAFYKAVHLVELLLAKKSLGHLSGYHSQRNNLLKRRYPGLWKDYGPLYRFSRVARYWCLHVEPRHVPPIIKRLERAERTVYKLLK